jgi:hypothetical protein
MAIGEIVSVHAICAQTNPPEVTREQVQGWLDEFSNWGRWGPDDELGTLNLITAEKRLNAASMVEEVGAVIVTRSTITATPTLTLMHSLILVSEDAYTTITPLRQLVRTVQRNLGCR